jgi:hypothetical protein
MDTLRRIWKLLVVLVLFSAVLVPSPALAQTDDPAPPEQVVKLIFIHHSSGENWLADDNGGLGRTLGENHYFVSDTNYGWGPDAIGDRTDIINWREWFRGPDSPRYLEALYNESGQNAAYTRSLSDPGGENEIVLFKSCFPNSNLEGNPGDPPQDQGDALTVSNAKFIYNDLLNYFITRPDKLFIVITAPPVQDSTYAANARALNTWLVEDWLSENNYPYNNVAVFDFYNVLTGKNNHHQFLNGTIEYITNQGKNTAAYPSDDDHPSATGNRKATGEFIPLLNVYYHRWKAGAGAPVATQPEPTITAALPTEAPTVAATATRKPAAAKTEIAVAPAAKDVIDNFENDVPLDTEGWQVYFDESTSTQMNCRRDTNLAKSGTASLRIEYTVAASSWGTCALSYTSAQNWSNTVGISFSLHAEEAGKPFSVGLFGGSSDEQETYIFWAETSAESLNGWQRVTIPWEQITRAEWEAEGHAPFNPVRVWGLSFGFDGLADAASHGVIWVDNLVLVKLVSVDATPEPSGSKPTLTSMPPEPTAELVVPTETSAPLPEATQTPPTSDKRGGGGPCSAPLVVVGAMVVVVSARVRKNRLA